MLEQPLSRDDAWAALLSELDYQVARWNKDTTVTEGNHSVTEFLVFMDDYLREAKTMVSRNGEPGASEAALHIVRKITALGVSCMMQNGAPHR
jgi:hypothetical protein